MIFKWHRDFLGWRMAGPKGIWQANSCLTSTEVCMETFDSMLISSKGLSALKMFPFGMGVLNKR